MKVYSSRRYTGDCNAKASVDWRALNILKVSVMILRFPVACEQAPVGDSRVQSRANGMSRERSGEEGVRRGACRHSIDAAVP